MTYEILKIVAFSDDNRGGNPAGVVIEDHLVLALKSRKILAAMNYE